MKPVAGPVEIEHFGTDREPDWRVERRPDGSHYWIVIDWQGATVAHGTTCFLGEAVTAAVKWST